MSTQTSPFRRAKDSRGAASIPASRLAWIPALVISLVVGVNLVREIRPALLLDPDPSWALARLILWFFAIAGTALAGGVAAAGFLLWGRTSASQDPPEPLPFRKTALTGLACIAVLLGALLRFVWLDRLPEALWIDDVSEIEPALELRGRWSDFADSVRPVPFVENSRGVVGVLYLEVFRLGLRLAGTTVFGLQLLSALAGVLSLATAMLVARQVLPRGGGALTALILAGPALAPDRLTDRLEHDRARPDHGSGHAASASGPAPEKCCRGGLYGRPHRNGAPYLSGRLDRRRGFVWSCALARGGQGAQSRSAAARRTLLGGFSPRRRSALSLPERTGRPLFRPSQSAKRFCGDPILAVADAPLRSGRGRNRGSLVHTRTKRFARKNPVRLDPRDSCGRLLPCRAPSAPARTVRPASRSRRGGHLPSSSGGIAGFPTAFGMPI